MARTPMKREKQEDAENEEETSSSEAGEEKSTVPLEVLNDPNLPRAETIIPQKPPSAVPPPPVCAPVAAASSREHRATRYRVQSSPGKVVYNGQIVAMPPGRILDSRSVSVEALKQQGVMLVELPD